MKVFKGLLLITILLIASNSFGQDKAHQTKKFGWIDTDGNKEVTLEEMVEFHKDKTNKKGDPIDGKGMFLGLDSNDDGKLTLEEFVKPINWKAAKEKARGNKQKTKGQKTGKSKGLSTSSKAYQTKKFGWIDADGNKEVTLEEMVEFHKGKTNKKGEPVQSELMFLGLDSNDDGKLTLEEFSQRVNWKAAKEKQRAN